MAMRRSGGTDRPKIARWKKAVALIPLALLAGAWAVSLGSPTTATADSADQDPGVPGVPTTSFDQPASLTSPSETTFPTISPNGNQPALDDPEDPSSVSANGIPAAAMAAYNRAEAVMAEADPSCHLSWALVAAIGRVESDHGRFGGNVLSSDGVATPGIYGLPLDGSHHTAIVADTDGGSVDHDAAYDRAVGPMQFIPGTWDVVGVDADGDGQKNPQDIDDAALATAVYLCAGTQDLSTREGQRSAVFSYNHSEQYVALVLTIMQAYLDGDYTEVADGLPVSTFIPLKAAAGTPPHPGVESRHHGTPRANTPSSPSTSDDQGIPSDPGNDPGSADPGSDDPSNPKPTNPTTSTPSVPGTPSLPDPTQVVDPVTKATAYCQSQFAGNGIDPTSSQLQDCVNAFLSGGAAAANNVISDILDLLGDVGVPLPTPQLPGVGG